MKPLDRAAARVRVNMPTTDKETVLAKYPAARCIPNYNGLDFAIRNKQKEAGLSSWQATEAKAWADAAYRVKNGQRFSGEYVPTATFYSVYPPPPPRPTPQGAEASHNLIRKPDTEGRGIGRRGLWSFHPSVSHRDGHQVL